MFQNTKCECGHQNPVGTVLCEACGKPLLEAEVKSDEVLEMRYDGMARRSQRMNPKIIDRIWNFFSSVKIAVYMIVFTLVGSMLGTIYPQESTFLNIDPSVYYKDTYGQLGHIYYLLGLSHTYESWWFILLLVLIGASLVICSLDRVLPLYKALNKQKIRKHMQFLTRQRLVYQGSIDEASEDWIKKAVTPLKKKGYRVHTEGTALLAEKQRFSRWGPYVLHIGLIIFLLAVLVRGIPGLNLDEHVAFPEGEIKKIPNTSMYLKNEQFNVEFYSEDEVPEQFRNLNKTVPKLFVTKVVLYECTADCSDPSKKPQLSEVARHDVRVNHPLNYNGLKAYQFDYDLTPTIRSVTPDLVNTQTGEKYGAIQIAMVDTQRSFEAGPYSLSVKEKYMDFGLDENGEPKSKSPSPNAPAFLFNIKGPDLPKEGMQYLYFAKQVDKQRFQQDAINKQLNGGEIPLQLEVDSMDKVDIIQSVSYLNIRIDKAMPFVWVGAGIVMLGLVMGFYWHHRRIWIRIDDGQLTLGGHTNKNWFGFRREVAAVLKHMNVEVDEKSLDNGGEPNMSLLDFSSDAFIVSFFLYCAAFMLYGVAVMGKKWSNRDPQAHVDRWGKRAFIASTVALAAHLIFFGTRWAGAGHIPVSNMYEFMSFLSMMIMVAFIVVYAIYRKSLLGLFALPLTILIMAYAAVFPQEVQPLIPALQSIWLKIHVTLAALGEAFFAVGFAAGFMYLLRTVDFSGKDKSSRRQRGWVEFTLITIVVVVGFIGSVFAFRASGYEAVFVKQTTSIDTEVQENSTIEKVIYRMPPIFAPYDSEVESIKPFLGMKEPLLETPSWMNGVNAGRKLNTVVWSLIVGLLLYGLIRLIVRRPLGQALQPMLDGIDEDDLDEISYRAIAIGFPIFTLGALIFAMIWAQIAWSRFWGWDPKEVWALITWLYYSVYLHLRLSRGWQGRKSAWLAVLGFLVVMFTLVGVNLIIAGLHSYAGAD